MSFFGKFFSWSLSAVRPSATSQLTKEGQELPVETKTWISIIWPNLLVIQTNLPCITCRPKSFDEKGALCDPLDAGGHFPIRKSQDAAVGKLVDMLTKAACLQQDTSSLVDLSQDSRPKMWSSNSQECNPNSEGQAVQQAASSSVASSRLVASKTTADALEELRGYKEMMKDLLLRQAGRSNTSANCT